MVRTFFVALAMFAAVGCGSGSDSCLLPAAATTVVDASADGAAGGCGPMPQFNECEVESDGSQRCHDICKPSEYALTCTRADPEAALHCRQMPVHTPMDVAIYCCRCGG